MWWLLSQVAAAGAQLLARLRVVEAVAKFQAAGEALARMHASGTAPETQAAQVAIGEAASTLAAVAQALASSGAAAEQPAPPIVSALQGQGMHIFPDPLLVEQHSWEHAMARNIQGVLSFN